MGFTSGEILRTNGIDTIQNIQKIFPMQRLDHFFGFALDKTVLYGLERTIH